MEKQKALVNSYVSIVRGPFNENCDKEPIEKILVLPFGYFIVETWKHACLVNARDFSILPNLRMFCFDDGFNDFEICYVGGLWSMFEFKSSDETRYKEGGS